MHYCYMKITSYELLLCTLDKNHPLHDRQNLFMFTPYLLARKLKKILMCIQFFFIFTHDGIILQYDIRHDAILHNIQKYFLLVISMYI